MGTVEDVVARALPGRSVRAVQRIGADRGVFSRVHRVELDGSADPASVVVKEPDPGPNGAAAAASGAYRREALCYRSVLPETPVSAPACYLVDDGGGDTATLVLEDLTLHRGVDQVEGLGRDEVLAVAEQLAALHRHWVDRPRDLADLRLRRSAVAALDPEALERGRAVLDGWSELDAGGLAALDGLLAGRQRLVDAFAAARPVTVCHGDPRADNVVFDGEGRAVLFDWQQAAVQFPEADLAWLAATSLEPQVRRAVERELVEAHARRLGHHRGAAWDRYRLGLVLPCLAVLMLVQRQLDTSRGRDLVAASVRRIATAASDLEVASLSS